MPINAVGSKGELSEVVCGPDTVMRNCKFTIVGEIEPIENTAPEVSNITVIRGLGPAPIQE